MNVLIRDSINDKIYVTIKSFRASPLGKIIYNLTLNKTKQYAYEIYL